MSVSTTIGDFQFESSLHGWSPRSYPEGFSLKPQFFRRFDGVPMTGTGLGERAIVRAWTRWFRQPRSKLPLGFDDDVSAFPLSPRKWLILKTDSLVGSTDIPPGMSLRQASRKAVVATVSDFAAKGVQPSGLLISIALHPPVRLGMIREIAAGINEAAREYHCEVIGGDTGESTDLLIDCIGFGFANSGMVVRRDGARLGDVIAVTGEFGKTSAGLRILLSREKALASRFPNLVRSVTHPVARLETGVRLAKTHMVNSSIDSSDGLAWSLHEIARLSRVKMVLEKVPVASGVASYAAKRGLDEDEMALYGGEEYELVLTIPKKNFPILKSEIPSLIKIGLVEKGGGEVILRHRGREKLLEPRGWEHMVSRAIAE